jgi:hypothetical protein
MYECTQVGKTVAQALHSKRSSLLHLLRQQMAAQCIMYVGPVCRVNGMHICCTNHADACFWHVLASFHK